MYMDTVQSKTAHARSLTYMVVLKERQLGEFMSKDWTASVQTDRRSCAYHVNDAFRREQCIFSNRTFGFASTLSHDLQDITKLLGKAQSEMSKDTDARHGKFVRDMLNIETHSYEDFRRSDRPHLFDYTLPIVAFDYMRDAPLVA